MALDSSLVDDTGNPYFQNDADNNSEHRARPPKLGQIMALNLQKTALSNIL